MKSNDKSKARHRFGFTLVELLVVIGIIVVLVSILMPALGKALRAARSTEDKNQARSIHGALLLFATGNEGELPRPSVLVGKDNSTVVHDATDTTANLMSMMIGRNFLKTESVISPVESNPNIRDMNETDLVYNYDGIDGDTVYWDDQFIGDISIANATDPANNSYAHQALWGERVRLKWNSGAGTSDVIISNRGPEEGKFGDELVDSSNTLKFHGDDSTWKGVIVTGDGSTRFAESVFPEGIGYQPLDGTPLGADNLFFPEWWDIVDGDGEPSGDNWLVICTEADEETQTINVVWD